MGGSFSERRRKKRTAPFKEMDRNMARKWGTPGPSRGGIEKRSPAQKRRSIVGEKPLVRRGLGR